MAQSSLLGSLLRTAADHLGSPEGGHFKRALEMHFKRDPRELPIVGDSFQVSDLPNVHLAVEAYATASGRSHRLLGVTQEHTYEQVRLAKLLADGSRSGATAGPVTYHTVQLADGKSLSCVSLGLYLVSSPSGVTALLLNHNTQRFNAQLDVEVMGDTREVCESALAEIRRHMREHNVFRGHLVSLSMSNDHNLVVSFHQLQAVQRESVILPEDVLARVERQSIGFSAHKEALRRAGRHLKRGMLLWGPPGTGKTLTAMYLATQMRDRTVITLTGRSLGLISASCKMARWLQPSTVILEDVDLVAENRRTNDGCLPILFELLNEMDGLNEDADILFILTTNRPEALEPALASRPGRVDLAVEVPLPDEGCRRRLIELYGSGLRLQPDVIDSIASKTEGVSGAFIKELMRRASLFAADDGDASLMETRHVDDALRELLSGGGPLTRSLLGAGVRTTQA